MNIIILHTSQYDFTDEKSGKNVSGIKVQYIFNDDMMPLVVDKNEQGYQVANGTLAIDKARSIKDVPGVYEALFVTRVNAKQQPLQKLLDVNFISTVPELFVSQAKKGA